MSRHFFFFANTVAGAVFVSHVQSLLQRRAETWGGGGHRSHVSGSCLYSHSLENEWMSLQLGLAERHFAAHPSFSLFKKISSLKKPSLLTSFRGGLGVVQGASA